MSGLIKEGSDGKVIGTTYICSSPLSIEIHAEKKKVKMDIFPLLTPVKMTLE